MTATLRKAAAEVIVFLIGAVFLVLVACLAGPLTADPAKPSGTVQGSFETEVKPFLAKYCLSCHSGEKPKGGVGLDKYLDEASLVKFKDVWDLVVQNLRQGTMPPPDKPRPTPGEIERLADWIEKKITQVDCQKARIPGRVTLRRLNRAEYNNTIRDLVGVKFQPADDFPADDVGYGFDNIGDVLSLPPMLLEKYLAAAEKIMALALAPDPRGAAAPVQHFEGKTLLSTLEREPGEGVKILFTQGEVYALADFPAAGEYLLRVRCYGQQAGPEPCRMAIRYDGKDLQTVEVPQREVRPGRFEVRFRAEAGKRRVAVAFLNDFYQPDHPDPAQRDRNLVVMWLEVEGPVDRSVLPLNDIGRKIIFVQPSETVPHREAARQVISRFATRAYRRPVREDELARLLDLYDLAERNGEPFVKRIELALTAVLVSPHFLFKVELDRPPTRPDGSYPISDFELATRLSYFLWSSMPDEELFALAEKGVLRKDGNLEAQARRMLKDEKAYALVENFAGQWLQIRSLAAAQPDPDLFPEFDEALRFAMLKETELYFWEIVREDRSILEFLDSDWTFVNERLARHYGISGVRGSQFRKVTLTGEQRGGLLTQASILTVTSNPTRTSPVKRGKWILENILNTPPPPPAPDAGELSEAQEDVAKASLRQRMEQHRSNPACATCHQRMDPLGFALENYNAVGAWRTKDGNFDIDPSGELPSGEKFANAKELKQVLLRRQDQFRKCLADRLLTYALGRGLESYDRCVVDEIAAAVARDGNRFSRLVVEIVKSEPFQYRGPRPAKP
jgi:hypothetical protein